MGKDDVKGHVEFSEAQGNVFDEAGLGWYSYIKDQVGSITQVYSRENYSMAETRTYDVFGNLISKTGNSNCNLGFQGKYYDQESGLYYYYHRYYYPTIVRFINEDPVGMLSGINLYQFTNNNPINVEDLFGLKIVCKRVTRWKPATVLEDPNNKGKLISEEIQDVFRLVHEQLIMSRLFPIPRYNCLYHFLKRMKISTYQKKRLYEAEFECSDECIKYTETRQKSFLDTYKIKSTEDYIGPQRISQIFYHPCFLTLIK